MEADTVLKAENIKKLIGNYEILKGINFSVKKGEFVSIVGASGSGKSTLLYILGLLDTPTEGKIFLENREVDFSQEKKLAALRNRKFGFIFQFHYLIPEFTALENVMIPMLKVGVDLKRAKEKAEYLLERLGLKDKILRKPYQLSGGEQQRVAIARALANDPILLLADEPTGNLDSVNTQKVMEIFQELNSEGTTIVMVTHERELTRMTHRVVEIKDGEIVKETTPA
ncbi:MAG TPA: ABC transporter ATP-binding protein [Aquifex aeolicus]|nr:ABC transporter ATP-binding protein [Aquifex aeolicus]